MIAERNYSSIQEKELKLRNRAFAVREACAGHKSIQVVADNDFRYLGWQQYGASSAVR